MDATQEPQVKQPIYSCKFVSPQSKHEQSYELRKYISAPDKDTAARIAKAFTEDATSGFYGFSVKGITKCKENGNNSPKQRLHSFYFQSMGAIAMAKKSIDASRVYIRDAHYNGHITSPQFTNCMMRDLPLVNKQLDKTVRDLQDMFRKLGLKIK